MQGGESQNEGEAANNQGGESRRWHEERLAEKQQQLRRAVCYLRCSIPGLTSTIYSDGSGIGFETLGIIKEGKMER